MSEPRNLKNPPAIEAIFDVRVVFQSEVKLKQLSQLHDKFVQNYPNKQEERILQFGLRQEKKGNPEATTQDHGIRGYRFLSNDGKEIVQCRKDGFTFNRLKPYLGWKEVSDKALNAWNLYDSSLSDKSVTRVALRYINRFNLPNPSAILDLDAYLNVNPPGPLKQDYTYSSFFSKATFNDNQSALKANWLITDHPSGVGHLFGIILDIDVYLDNISFEEETLGNLWEKMRGFKNNLFFASFTDKGISLFDEDTLI